GRPAITPDGATVLFCIRDRGWTHLYAVGVDGSEAPRPIVDGKHQVISALSVAGHSGVAGRGGVADHAVGASGRNGLAAIVMATRSTFGEVAIVDPDDGTTSMLTDLSGDIHPYETTEREFTVSDGG